MASSILHSKLTGSLRGLIFIGFPCVLSYVLLIEYTRYPMYLLWKHFHFFMMSNSSESFIFNVSFVFWNLSALVIGFPNWPSMLHVCSCLISFSSIIGNCRYTQNCFNSSIPPINFRVICPTIVNVIISVLSSISTYLTASPLTSK